MKNSELVWGVRHRPAAFSAMRGNKDALKTLKSVRNSVLISGPSGSGKTTAALILCAALEGEKIEASAGTDTGIENIRAIIERVKFKPMTFSRYIIIVDEAHALTKAVINVLLTELEKPVENGPLWVLITNKPEVFPVTLTSRLTTINLKKPNHNEMIDYAYDVLEAENILVENDVVEACVNSADGSFRLMINLLERCVKAGLHVKKLSYDELMEKLPGLETVSGPDSAITLLANFIKDGSPPNANVMAVYNQWTSLLLEHLHKPEKPSYFYIMFMRELGSKKLANNHAAYILRALNEARVQVVTASCDGISALTCALSER